MRQLAEELWVSAARPAKGTSLALGTGSNSCNDEQTPIIARRESVMSANVDKFCNDLRDRLNAIERRVESVKADVKAFPGQGEKVLRDKLEAARNRLNAEKERVNQMRTNFEAQARQKIAESKEAVSEWKKKHETRMLNARADRANEYAGDAVALAVASIDEAEEAILDAVVARIDADAAK